MPMASWVSLRAVVHALDLDDDAWVDALFTEGRALLDEGLGMFVYTYRVDPGQRIRLGALAGEEAAPAFWQTLAQWGAENARSLARIYGTGTGWLHDALPAAERRGVLLSEARATFDAHGVGDVLTIVGHDAAGTGIFLTVPCARRSPEITSGHGRVFERLSLELAAVVRLREQRRRTHVARLSTSEKLVAERLIEGASDKAIAVELGVSLSTVSTFARRVRNKLGCQRGQEVLALSATASRTGIARRLELFDALTPAECDVAAALLAGSSYADIAARRSVSVRTVASQCGAIFRKCDVSGRRALAAALLGGTSGK